MLKAAPLGFGRLPSGSSANGERFEPSSPAGHPTSSSLILMVLGLLGVSGMTKKRQAISAQRSGPCAILLHLSSWGVSSGEMVPSDLLVELARSGLARVVPPEVVRCPRRFREVLLDLLWSSLEAQVLRALQDSRAQPLAPDIRRYLEVGLRAERRLTNGEFAQSVYASRSTIWRRLKGARLPPLGTFVLRCRLIRATALLQDPETSGETAALRAGFYSCGHPEPKLGSSP